VTRARRSRSSWPAGSKEDDQQDPAELRAQAQAEARAEVLRERALDKVEARAAKLFADPEDARALLAVQVDDFVDDGQVDVDAIDEALAELLSKKPHLGAATAKRFQGGADGGARKGSGVAQLTEQDLKRMTPQQIDKARLSGQPERPARRLLTQGRQLMAITRFRPEIWSAALLVALQKRLVYAGPGVVNRDYEGEIARLATPSGSRRSPTRRSAPTRRTPRSSRPRS
jgi:hypothetical protein